MTGATISRRELRGRIDDFLLRRIGPDGPPLRLREFVPAPSWNRFDLGFKLLYLDGLGGTQSDFARRIYAEHIRAFSLGDMVEPGAADKRGLDRFVEDFEKMYRDIGRRGFDPGTSLVPLAADGSILNAGHRVACAIALGKPVTGVETGLEPVAFDHRFFAGRGVPEDDLDAAAVRLVEALPHAAIALLWPAARGRDREVGDRIGPLIYKRGIALSLQGGHTLLSRVYKGEPWLGDPAQNFPGIRPKLLQCFGGTDKLRALVFDAPPERDRVELKEGLRALYGIEKSSLHITDTHEEAVEIARLLLNHNGRHFLNTAHPARWPETWERLARIERYVTENGLSPDSFAVDTGMVLALYGLRPAGDIDVVSAAPLPPGPVERHAGDWRGASPADLVQDPARHFSFAGLRFASLREVASLKRKRLAGRDREDLLLMAPLLEAEDAPPGPPGKWMSLRMYRLRARRALIRSLMLLGIGRPLRTLYRRLRGRPSA